MVDPEIDRKEVEPGRLVGPLPLDHYRYPTTQTIGGVEKGATICPGVCKGGLVCPVRQSCTKTVPVLIGDMLQDRGAGGDRVRQVVNARHTQARDNLGNLGQ
ncbi:MAG TPA: hypothetical protein VG815_20365 [Chloroflexota bacterium]|nr:hypothetical protein [Chloroflexota bacterium]